MDFLEAIYKKVCKFLILRNFVYRFDIYNGTESANSIYDDQVMEYEFFNQGNTLCIINGGLFLYPAFTNISPNSVRMVVNANEMDQTIYEYKFVPLDFREFDFTFPGGGGTSISVPFISDLDLGELMQPFNRLIVKSKVVAVARK
jgi:hypothetical protein